MVELETRMIPKVTNKICHRRSYADDTFVFLKKGCVEYVLACLNLFHKSIKFIYELENQNKLPFVDVFLTRSATQKKYKCSGTFLQRTPSGPQNSVRYREVSAT